MKRIAEVLGVSRSNLADRRSDRTRPRGPYRKADDDDLLPLIRRFVDERPTYGYRPITALVNRELTRKGLPVANRKRVHRIMHQAALLLEPCTGRREGCVHDGKMMVMRSNLRWCSDGLEFACLNGEIIRMAFIIDAFEREIIAWAAVRGAGNSGSDVRDMMLEAVERRFGSVRAPRPIEHLSDNGQPLNSQGDTRLRHRAESRSLLHPVKSPESNGMSEAFVKTFKRDYLRICLLPDAPSALRQIARWIDDYNEIHPHSGLRMCSPREFIRAQT